MNAATLLVRCLEAEGVEMIFGMPGEENLAFLEALRTSRIRFITTRHEQTAGFMAATYGRLTGKPGVVLATLGPGATNLATAAAFAQLGAMPMVMLTGQKPIRKSKQGRFQIVDVVRLFEPLTQDSRQLVSAALIPAAVREAFRLAATERPGVAHLELPEDVAEEDASACQPLPAVDPRRPVAEAKAVEAAVALLRAARRPVLVVGAGANRTRTAAALRRLIDTHRLPFVTTQMGKGVVDERHELWLGNAALSSDDFPHRALAAADVIVNVGHDAVEKPPYLMTAGGATQVIHLHYTAAEVDSIYHPQTELVADIADSLARLGDGLMPTPAWDFAPFEPLRRALNEDLLAGAEDDHFPVRPPRLVADVRSVLPPEGIVALDNGIYKLWFARGYRAAGPNTVLLDNALATMGAGLPVAMAVRIVHPDRPVVAVCGDGGFLMNDQELETAVRLKLDLVVVILNDSAYGMVKWKQAAMKLGDFGLDFKNPCFRTLARAYGATGHRLEATAALAPLLRDCLAAGGVHLIDVPVDYSVNERLLSKSLAERTEGIIPAPALKP